MIFFLLTDCSWSVLSNMLVFTRLLKDPYHAIAEKGSLKAQRFLTVVDVQYPKYLEEASRQLWMRIWARVSSADY